MQPSPRRKIMAGTALGLAATLVAAGASAAAPLDGPRTYYVSADARGGDGSSPAAAFRTIQQCADVAAAGDTCEIDSGTYRETVAPKASGTVDRPITFRATPGADVVVNGTERLTGFTPVLPKDLAAITATDPYAADSLFSAAVQQRKIYSVPVDLGTQSGEEQVFIDGTMSIEASYPYPGTDLLDPDIRRAAAGSAEATIVDPQMTRPAGYWDGARALTAYWYITTTGAVASSDVGSITLQTAPLCVHKVVPTDTWYRLSGKIGELGYPGAHYYDATAKRLYLYSDDNPNSHFIEAKKRQLAFDLSSASGIHLEGLGLFASSVQTGTSSTGVVLDGIDAKYLSHYWDVTRGATNCGENVTRGVGDTGIVLNGTGNTVKNSTIQYSAGNGIALRGWGNTAIDNVITDVDYAGTYAAPVAVQGHSQTVMYNTMARVGRSGVNLQWNGVEGTVPGPDRIAYNDISGYASLSVDTAAIYTCCSSRMEGTQIDHNVLHDPNARPGGVYPFGMSGIYADNGQSDLRIHNNVGWGNPEGTVELNGLGSGSHDNLVYNNAGGMTLFYVKGPGQSTGSVVTNNIGPIRGLAGATDGGLVLSNNLLEGDPLFVDAVNHDYRLRAESPARNAAVPLPGYNDGSTDAVPSLGAFQYGAPAWTAGARR